MAAVLQVDKRIKNIESRGGIKKYVLPLKSRILHIYRLL